MISSNKKNKIYNPRNEVIFIHKQRPLIFTQQYDQKYKKKTFQKIYCNPIFNELSFLISDQYQTCQCENSIKECSKLKDILKESKKYDAKAIFQNLKQHSKQKLKQIILRDQNFEVGEVLLPHFISLMTVLQVENPSIIAQLLKHTKTDYVTFWIYGLFCSKFPSYDRLATNIIQIVQNKNLDVDLQMLLNPNNGQLKVVFDLKLLNIFKSSFPSIVNIICSNLKTQKIIQKLIICHFIKGKDRKQFQVIKAALQLQLI